MKKCSILRGDMDNFKILKILVNGNCIVVREMKILKREGGGMDFGGGEVGVEGGKLEARGEKNGVESWEETHSCFSRKSGFFSCKYAPILTMVKK